MFLNLNEVQYLSTKLTSQCGKETLSHPLLITALPGRQRMKEQEKEKIKMESQGKWKDTIVWISLRKARRQPGPPPAPTVTVPLHCKSGFSRDLRVGTLSKGLPVAFLLCGGTRTPSDIPPAYQWSTEWYNNQRLEYYRSNSPLAPEPWPHPRVPTREIP